MEIIRRGTIPANKIWIGTCQSCKSIIEAKQSEVTVHHEQRDGDWADAQCPVCQVKMTFHEKK